MTDEIIPRKELEGAYARIQEMEKNVDSKATERRTALYTSLQTALVVEPPVAYSSTELSDAYQAGKQVGVSTVFEQLDQIGAIITDVDGVTLNISLDDNDELDYISLSKSWSSFINS